MKIKLKIYKEFDVKYLQLHVNVRYWDDAKIYNDDTGECGEKDEYHEIPCNNGNAWYPKIELETGKIVNWNQGIKAEIHYKVCDEGIYQLIDENGNIITSYSGYVPSILCPKEAGYGDYIIMDINEDGYINDWNPNLERYLEETIDHEEN
jgi:hypothetical protein